MRIKLIEDKVLKKYPDIEGVDCTQYHEAEEFYSDGVVRIKMYNSAGIAAYYVLEKDLYIREDIVDKGILVFNRGELLCTIRDASEYPDNTIMSLFVVGVDEIDYNVLQIKGMDHAMVIPEDIAMELNNILNNKKEDVNEKLPIVIKDYGKAYCPKCDSDIHGIGKISFCPNCGLGLEWPKLKWKSNTNKVKEVLNNKKEDVDDSKDRK